MEVTDDEWIIKMHRVRHQSLAVCYGKTFHAAFTRDLLSLQCRQESHDDIIVD